MDNYIQLFSLEGKKALITGGTGGLGGEIARAFLSCGADVAVCGGHPEKARELSLYAESIGRTCIALRCDVTEEQDVQQMMDQIGVSLQGLDIVVNSAGMNCLLPAEDYDTETFDRVMDLNVKGTFLVSREAGKSFMIPAKSGKIINISSVKGVIGTDADYIAYCTSKGAVNMFTRQLACEWGKYNICVNAVAPTFVRTDINAFQLDDPVFYASLTKRIPLGRIGQKCDIAAAAVFLASDASSFISGQILPVDGGLTAKQ